MRPAGHMTDSLFGAQLVVSKWLMSHGLNFTTAINPQLPGTRSWSLALQPNENGSVVNLLIYVAPGLFGVLLPLQARGHDSCDDVISFVFTNVSFVRFAADTTAGSRVFWLRAEFPIDEEPPHLLPGTIHVAIGTTMSTAGLIFDRFAGRFESTEPSTIPMSTLDGR